MTKKELENIIIRLTEEETDIILDLIESLQ